MVDLDNETYTLVRFAARVMGLSASDVIARAVRELSAEPDPAAEPPVPADPWEPVPIYGEYEGTRVDGKYLRATRRLTVLSPPLAGETFKTPSAAARAVVAALNPARASTQTNGWRFWRVAATHQRLEVFR